MQIRWAPSAVKDLERIFERVGKDRPEAAERVIRTIYQGCEALRTFAERGESVASRADASWCLHRFLISRFTKLGKKNRLWRSPVSTTRRRTGPKLGVGQVDVNGGRYNPLAPFGGYKQSGGELGVFGLEEYLQVKWIAR
jgi:plasmid stabilization system protein ParE